MLRYLQQEGLVSFDLTSKLDSAPSRGAQELLDQNFECIYQLQLAQQQRMSSDPTVLEKELAAKVQANLVKLNLALGKQSALAKSGTNGP